MVKPDPGDDSIPQLRRPHSTGNTSDTMTPGTPHSAPPPQYPDDRRHLSFDNGQQQPPPMYRQTSYPPPTPMAHPQSYDYPPSYGPAHAEMYPIQIASASNKRKAQRASQVSLPSRVCSPFRLRL